MNKLFIFVMTIVSFLGLLSLIVTIQGKYDVLYKIGEGIGGCIICLFFLLLMLAVSGFSITIPNKKSNEEDEEEEEAE